MEHWKKKFFTIWIGQAFSLFGSSLVDFALIWWLVTGILHFSLFVFWMFSKELKKAES